MRSITYGEGGMPLPMAIPCHRLGRIQALPSTMIEVPHNLRMLKIKCGFRGPCDRVLKLSKSYVQLGRTGSPRTMAALPFAECEVLSAFCHRPPSLLLKTYALKPPVSSEQCLF